MLKEKGRCISHALLQTKIKKNQKENTTERNERSTKKVETKLYLELVLRYNREYEYRYR